MDGDGDDKVRTLELLIREIEEAHFLRGLGTESDVDDRDFSLELLKIDDDREDLDTSFDLMGHEIKRGAFV